MSTAKRYRPLGGDFRGGADAACYIERKNANPAP